MNIVKTRVGHEEILANYFAVNEQHLKRWSPAVPKDHHSLESWRNRLQVREQEHERGESAHFIGTDDVESHVIGTCSLTNITRGVFQACYMGYSVAQRYEGEGYMKRIVQFAVRYGFNDLKLHRIMANHMPDNERSAGLLRSLGFKREGYAERYLLIGGRWEDHVLNALINEKYRGR